MATIVKRADLPRALTVAEMDGNFDNLNNDKIESANGTATGTFTAENIAANNLVDTIIRGKVQALGDVSGTVNIDTTAGDTITCKITGNTTFTVSGIVNGSVNTLYFVIENIGAGTVTWPGTTTFNTGGTIQTSPTGKTMIILDTVDNGVTYMGVQSWRDYA
jgi:molybdopterin-binding protein